MENSPQFKSFYEAVALMRKLQKDYFRRRYGNILEQCKKQEKLVDEMLEEHLTQTNPEHQKQPDLFT